MRKYRLTMRRYKIKFIMRIVNLHRGNVNSQWETEMHIEK